MKVEHQSQGYFTYECHDPNCAYCEFIKRKQFLREQVIKALKESIPKVPRIVIKRPHRRWSEPELLLLKELVHIPTHTLLRDKTFGDRSKAAIDERKVIIRREYHIKPLPRNYRIYHN